MLPDENKVYRDKLELERDLGEVSRNESVMMLRLLGAQGLPTRKIVGVMVSSGKSDLDIFSQDLITPLIKTRPDQITFWMPELKFPINKDSLIRYGNKLAKHLPNALRRDGRWSWMDFIEKLPDTNKTYRDVSELEEDILKIANTDKNLIKKMKQHGGDKVERCLIDYTVDHSMKEIIEASK